MSFLGLNLGLAQLKQFHAYQFRVSEHNRCQNWLGVSGEDVNRTASWIGTVHKNQSRSEHLDWIKLDDRNTKQMRLDGPYMVHL